MISVDILIANPDSATSRPISTATSINHPQPATTTSSQPKYIIREIQPSTSSIQQDSSSIALNNQQGTQFALMVNHNNSNSCSSILMHN